METNKTYTSPAYDSSKDGTQISEALTSLVEAVLGPGVQIKAAINIGRIPPKEAAEETTDEPKHDECSCGDCCNCGGEHKERYQEIPKEFIPIPRDRVDDSDVKIAEQKAATNQGPQIGNVGLYGASDSGKLLYLCQAMVEVSGYMSSLNELLPSFVRDLDRTRTAVDDLQIKVDALSDKIDHLTKRVDGQERHRNGRHHNGKNNQWNDLKNELRKMVQEAVNGIVIQAPVNTDAELIATSVCNRLDDIYKKLNASDVPQTELPNCIQESTSRLVVDLSPDAIKYLTGELRDMVKLEVNNALYLQSLKRDNNK